MPLTCHQKSPMFLDQLNRPSFSTTKDGYLLKTISGGSRLRLVRELLGPAKLSTLMRGTDGPTLGKLIFPVSFRLDKFDLRYRLSSENVKARAVRNEAGGHYPGCGFRKRGRTRA